MAANVSAQVAAGPPVSKEQAAAQCEAQREIEFPGIPYQGGGSCGDTGVSYYASSPGGFWYDNLYFPYDETNNGSNLGDGGGCNGGVGGGGSCPKNAGAVLVGDPINPITGNKIVEELDSATEPALTLRRFYNSSTAVSPGSMGTHWRHSFDRKLQIFVAPGERTYLTTATVLRPDGKFEVFSKVTAGGWVASAENPDILQEIIKDQIVTGYTLRVSALRITETYSSDGLLQTISDDAGRVTTLTYSTAATPSSIAPAAGLLLSVTAQDGRMLTFAYDASSRVNQVTLPDTARLSYTYDAAANLLTVQYPDNASKTYHYNESEETGGNSLLGALTGIVDESAQRFETTTYDGDGRATSSYGPSGADSVSIQYSTSGYSRVTYSSGAQSWRQYVQVRGRTLSSGTSTPCGSCDDPYQSRTYDLNSYPSSYTDFNGVVKNTTYDATGLLTKEVDAVGRDEERTTTTVWNPSLRVPLVTTTTDKSGATVSKQGWSYNALGLTTATCLMDPAKSSTYTCTDAGTGHAGVRRTVMTYCTTVDATACPLVGLLLKVDGPRTDVTDTHTYVYYLTTDESACTTAGGTCHHAGDLQSVTDGTGLVTTYVSYDKAGRPTRIKGPNGVLTDFAYTPRGWLASKTVRANASGTISPMDSVTAVSYDPTGTVHSITDADGVMTSYGYDAAHRLTDITDASGNRVHYTLDAAGHRTSEQVLNTAGAVIRSLGRTFNNLGQLTMLTDGMNRTVLNASFSDSYDGNGNLVHATDGLGVQQQNIIDGLSRLSSTIHDYQGSNSQTANAQSVTTFDALDRTTGFSDPDGLNTTYDIDAFGNVTTLSSPDTGVSTRSFDIVGNLTATTDAANISHTSTYDANNRLLKSTYTDTTANLQFKYDEADTATGCTGNYGRGYVSRVIENNGGIMWCYDGRGNVVSKRQTVGNTTRTTTYAWTLANRLKSVTTPNGTVISYTRNTLGQITSVQATPTGGPATIIASAAVYQPFGFLASYKLGDGQTVTLTYDATGALTDIASTAFSLHVARDVMGNVIAIGDAPGVVNPTEAYGYDALYRLTGVKAANGEAIEAYTYNKTGDRLTKAAPGLLTGSYAYAAGTHHLTGVGTTARQVDARGNTTANVLASGAFGFGYSPRNRLTVVQNNGVTVGSYILNALGQRIQKTAGTTSTRFDYDEDSKLISEAAGTVTRDYVWMDGVPVGILDRSGASATVNFVHADGMGSPRAVTNAGGTVLWQWAYAGNPFGEKAPTSASGYVLNLRFPGQYFDSESGLNYNVNRDYEAATGRYSESDPKGVAAGINTYAYSLGNPLLHSDPSGLQVVETMLRFPVSTLLSDEPILPRPLISPKPGFPERPLPKNFPQLPKEGSQCPGDGWEWRGPDSPGGTRGSWYNAEQKWSLHPDLEHAEPIGPHWDWVDENKAQYRLTPQAPVAPGQIY